MHWLEALDTALFRFCNSTLQNPFLDWLMPIASGNPIFFPLLAVFGITLVVKGNARVRVMLLMLLIILPLGDTFICNTIKHAVMRLRPFAALEGVHQLVLAGRDNSMPSSHSANWAAATMIVFIYYGRRSLWFMLPLGFTVSFSRIYNGVHFPADVLAGWILGAGYAATGVWLLNQLWQSAGKKFFPIWQQQLPSLINCELRISNSESSGSGTTVDSQFAIRNSQFLRLGYTLIFLALVARLAYLAAGVIELSEDETYYWLWSKHPALSYYSKPPLVAATIWLGTHLFGDTAFGVRFFSPVIAAALGLIVFRFMARETNARTAFVLLCAIGATPMLAVGATLMTIDPLSVLFWTAAMFAGWRAVQENSTTRDWLWVGVWMGLGFLSKYTALFQLLCWATFFALAPAARKQLRRPGPWLALAVNTLAALPVLIWNWQHGWITVRHVADDAHAGDRWKFTLHEFLTNEFGLLNPVFFVLAVWAAIAFWRKAVGVPASTPALDMRGPKAAGDGGAPVQARALARAAAPAPQLQVFLFSMGAPLFLVYALWSCRSRVMPNWIAPSILPLFCLAAIYWQNRWREISRWLIGGMIFGYVIVAVLHQPAWIQQVTGRSLPRELSRVCAWRETVAVIRAAQQKLAAEGKPVFVIGGHYGAVSQMAFGLRRERVETFCLTADAPKNQFFFWPGYTNRHGDSAVYFQVLGSAVPQAPPARLTNEFASVTGAGVFPVDYHGKTIRWVQIFECLNLR